MGDGAVSFWKCAYSSEYADKEHLVLEAVARQEQIWISQHHVVIFKVNSKSGEITELEHFETRRGFLNQWVSGYVDENLQ